MTVWSYSDAIVDEDRLRSANDAIDERRYCIFCQSELDLREFYEDPDMGLTERHIAFAVESCVCCGWWFASSQIVLRRGGHRRLVTGAAAGSLRALDLTDLSTPIADVQAYLAARYCERFDVAWELFEDVVSAVFSGLGYQTRVTGRSGDGGIDVILDGPDGHTVGVQVKRYKNSIKAEQIRELTGALVIEGITEGIFVTTSTFQRGAVRTARASAARGIPITLLDSTRFYDALKIAQCASPGVSFRETPGLIRPKLKLIRVRRLH